MSSNKKNESLPQNNVAFLAIVVALSLLTYIPAVFPFSLVRLVFYGGVAAMALMRVNKGSGKKLPVVLIAAAAVVDVVPGLSLIPAIPTILNVAGIVLAFKDKQEQ